MLIVIDMQGAQTESRFRGIGRYSLSLALAIARQSGAHEIILALNGLFSETIQPIREAFYGVLPQNNILVWDGVGPTRETNPDNRLRREASERLREEREANGHRRQEVLDFGRADVDAGISARRRRLADEHDELCDRWSNELAFQ
jgi:hypothetical protein